MALEEWDSGTSSRRGSDISKESGEISSRPSSSGGLSTNDGSLAGYENASNNNTYSAEANDQQSDAELTTTDPKPRYRNGKLRRPDSLTRICDITKDQKAYQYRYFKLSNPYAPVCCPCCGKHGHMDDCCPDKTCMHCGGPHFARCCPDHKKCHLCRKRGHNAKDCRGRVVVGGGPGDPCDICGELGHVERECAQIGCTFKPSKEFKKIPAHKMMANCYNCGASGFLGRGGHFGDDCPTLPAWKKQSFNKIKTWSAENARQYIIDDGNDAGGEDAHKSAAVGHSENAYQLSAFDDMRD